MDSWFVVLSEKDAIQKMEEQPGKAKVAKKLSNIEVHLQDTENIMPTKKRKKKHR